MEPRLLTRDEFREGVFKRDGYKCVFCDNPAKDAHHIMERKLWSEGGYYMDNGASVCEEHHLACERTDITTDEVRRQCGITRIVLPDHLCADQEYDKWGNIILPNGRRLKGELFYDESVQKVIKQHLGEFTTMVKYPRTYHLPWSDNMNDDDRMMDSTVHFVGKRVVVTEKMDGENTTMYCDHTHARSVDSTSNPTRSWVKNFWATIAQDIPSGWRICGENLWAKHSIRYEHLPSYFMGFSLWNDRNECLSWNETIEWFDLLGITPVPVLYEGIYDEFTIRRLYKPEQWDTSEGYVVRLAEKFSSGDFRQSVGKYVRKGHIQTVKHWIQGAIQERNTLFVESK